MRRRSKSFHTNLRCGMWKSWPSAVSRKPVRHPKPRSRRDAFYDEVELALKETLGRKGARGPGRGKGTLEIEFYSNEDLKDLANKLGE